MIFSFMVTVCVVAALLPFSRALVTCFGGRGLTNEWESITRMSVPGERRDLGDKELRAESARKGPCFRKARPYRRRRRCAGEVPCPGSHAAHVTQQLVISSTGNSPVVCPGRAHTLPSAPSVVHAPAYSHALFDPWASLISLSPALPSESRALLALRARSLIRSGSRLTERHPTSEFNKS